MTALKPETTIDAVWCKKCNRFFSKDCEICNGTGSSVKKTLEGDISPEEISAMNCKYGCNSLKGCKGRCDKTSLSNN